MITGMVFCRDCGANWSPGRCPECGEVDNCGAPQIIGKDKGRVFEKYYWGVLAIFVSSILLLVAREMHGLCGPGGLP